MKLKYIFATTLFTSSILFGTDAWSGSYGKLSPINGTDSTYVITVPAQSIPSTAAELFEMTGSASKVVRVQEILVDTWNTAGGYASITYFNVYRRSSAASGGAATSVTPAKLDTNNSASSIVSSKYFTTAPTAGSLVDTLARILIYSVGMPIPWNRALFKADTPSQAITLRGASDYLTVGVTANAYNNGAYGTYLINVKFTESAN
ncbi:MAG: hypothetical protein JST16_15705 [Bdellovibrionales bacterium]|nr:hypothetical protein [Bdellovibrionales bacterium]